MIDHFSWLAPVYEWFIPPPDPDEYLKFLNPDPSFRLLDAGGGTGRVAMQLKSVYAQIIVADVNRKMLHQAIQKPGLQSVNGHIETLPFSNESFHHVIVIDALHHFCDHQESLEEIIRVLKPGGKLLIHEPDIQKLHVKIIAFFEKIALMRSQFLAPVEIQNIFSGMNLHCTIHRDDGFSARLLVEKPR